MAIVQGGRVLSARGYGITDVHQPETVDAHTVFRLASLSKSFAATAAGMLVAMANCAGTAPSSILPDAAALRSARRAAIDRGRGIEPPRRRRPQRFDRDLERNAEYASLVQKLAYTPMKCAPGRVLRLSEHRLQLIGDVGRAPAAKRSTSGRAPSVQAAGYAGCQLRLEAFSPARAGPSAHPRGRGVRGQAQANLLPRCAAAGVNASISDMAQWLLAQNGYRPDVLSGSLLATLHAPADRHTQRNRGRSGGARA